MKLSKSTNRLALVSATLGLLVAFLQPSNAFFGIGGCPDKYPEVKNPFGTTGTIPNGMYYSHYLDD